MSKLIRIDEDCEEILRKYSDGSLSDCIRAMEKLTKVTAPVTTVTPLTNVTELAAVIKRMDRMEEGIRHVNGEFMNFISSGQGAVRIYEKKGFVRASDIRTDNTNLNDI
jgi:hypothetical protein